MKSLKRLLLLALMLPAPFLLAQTPATSTQPSAPSIPENQLTPRGTVKYLRTAVIKGDPAALVSVIATTSPAQADIVHIYAENAAAKAALRDAVYAKFPSAVPNPGELARSQIAQSDPAIDVMHETITGDEAVVTGNDTAPGNSQSQRMPLKRIDGKWKVPFEVIFPPTSTDLTGLTQTLTTETPVLKALAIDLSSGLFKSIDEFKQAGQKRMLQALADAIAAKSSSAAATRSSNSVRTTTTRP